MQNPGAIPVNVRGSQVWGSKWARGSEAHSQQLLGQASARRDCCPERDMETGLSEGALCTGQPGRPWEEKALAGLGETTPTGFGIHSKFSALVANARRSPKGLRGGEPAGDPEGFVGPVHQPLLAPGPHGLSAPGESQRPRLVRGSYVSNTVCQHT